MVRPYDWQSLAGQSPMVRFPAGTVLCRTCRLLHASPGATTVDGAYGIVVDSLLYRVDGRETSVEDDLMEAAAPTPLFDEQLNDLSIAVIHANGAP